MRRDIRSTVPDGNINGHVNRTTESDTQPIHEETDVLIIGAGFAGCYLLHYLRKHNFKAKIVEAGSDLGGVWYWNRYPGARVDSQYPVYALSIPEVWQDWYWSYEYPDHNELRRYFAHVEAKLGIKKDTYLDTSVEGADWDNGSGKWMVYLSGGRAVRTRFLIPALGFAAKRHFPDWPGLDKFQGEIHHSSFWPLEGVDVKGKKVAVVGTGATGVQIIQETAKEIGEQGNLTVFQRTPNIAFPMNQKRLSKERQDRDKEHLAETLMRRFSTTGGFIFDVKGRQFTKETPEQQQALFQEMWDAGGFWPLAAGYDDLLLDQNANDAAYQFWAKQTRERVHDDGAKDLLAPLTPPHAFGGKRPSLEQDYYEQFNRPNVHIVSTKKTPIRELVEDGIVTEDGKLHRADVIALATGFDAVTGGIKNIRLRGASGELLTEKWEEGILTHLGIAINGFPNLFMLYGPQAPTAFSNGPSCVEVQANWIIQALVHMRDHGLSRIDATAEAEQAWREQVWKFHKASLRRNVDGWYNGGNVPGKLKEPMNYSGGLPRYQEMLKQESEKKEYPGFTLT